MPKLRKILVLGQTGQLARALSGELFKTEYEAIFLNRQACDLSSGPDVLRRILEPYKDVDAVIIAAAYTQVDAAESNEDIAMAVNGRAPETIGKFAAANDIALVHISTDYVFNGCADVPYKTNHPVEPINVYGHTKAQGEQGLRSAQPRSSILRTSWVYDATGQNFLTTMLRLAQTRSDINVVNDQIGRPTYAPHLAKIIWEFTQGLIRGDKAFEGLFHVSGSGAEVSWAGFAREIFSVFSDVLPHSIEVHNVPSIDFPTVAKRPAYSVLNLEKTKQVLGYTLPDWREGVKAAHRQWTANINKGHIDE